jgi:hypothetical protein
MDQMFHLLAGFGFGGFLVLLGSRLLVPDIRHEGLPAPPVRLASR